MPALPTRYARRADSSRRRLHVESLEDRRLLAASPWQNPNAHLDVSNDGILSPFDMSLIIVRMQAGQIGELPAPNPNPPTAFVDTSGDNILSPWDLLRVINRLQSPPTAKISTLTPFTIDVTPQISVNVGGTNLPPNGTPVIVDVDLNADGDFDDPGELNYSQSTLYNGQSNFSLTTPLARKDVLYTVNLRARVLDPDMPIVSSSLELDVDTRTSDVLENYVHAFDPAYGYELKLEQAQFIPGQGTYTYYVLLMTSQSWRSAAEVNKPVWQHWVELYVPSTPSSTALLLIDGGNNQGFGGSPPAATMELGFAALATSSIVVHLRTVPSEPLIFSDEPGNSRTEDEIIAYSFDKYLNQIDAGTPNVETWPVLVAMAKSAVRAMDAAQEFIPTANAAWGINDFMVTGFSKRGWTTWLTSAVDDRVTAIIPGVFDNLNQGEQMAHHFGVYGFFSEAVHDYNDLAIFDRILTPQALELSQIIDPYRYLANGRFDDMPKLVLNSAGDEFFVSDSSQFYFHDLPGDENYMRYIPNTGHGLDTRALESTLTFFQAVRTGAALPQFSWTNEQDGSIRVTASTNPSAVRLWQATNPNARDFRRTWNPGITWTSTLLTNQGGGVYVGDVAMPDAGARAYFVELTFPSPFGISYVFTTDIRVKSTLAWHPWPFESGFPDDDASPFAGVALNLFAEGSLAALVEAFGNQAATAELTDVALAVSLLAVEEELLPAPALTPALARPAQPRFESAAVSALLEALDDAPLVGGDVDSEEQDALDAVFGELSEPLV